MSECVDADVVGPHEAQGASPRCAQHRRQRQQWRNRNAQRRARDPHAEDEPWTPAPLSALPASRQLTEDDRRYLDELNDEMRAASGPLVGAHVRQGRGEVRMSDIDVRRLLGAMTALSSALDEVLMATDTGSRSEKVATKRRTT